MSWRTSKLKLLPDINADSILEFSVSRSSSLGAKHDGVEENNCSSWDNYLMSPIFLPYNQNNSWVFSKCSKNMIKKYLANPEKYVDR